MNEWGFWGYLALSLLIILLLLSSEIGEAYIKGLTGHEPKIWAEKIGRSIRSVLE